MSTSLRDVSIQLSRLNHTVGERVTLTTTDVECLDLIARTGPLAPGDLASRQNLHPATMTGVLDRLEQNGWIARERDPHDRRRTRVRALTDRGAELATLYAGMAGALRDLYADYSAEELERILGFLTHVADAARTANGELSAPDASTR